MSSSRLLYYFLFIYILSLGFTDVWTLPFFGRKLQPPELIFIAGLLLWLFSGFQNWKLIAGRFSVLDRAILLYFLAAGFSSIFVNELSSYLELAGVAYLVAVYFLFSLVDLSRLPRLLIGGFSAAGVLAGLSGIVGFVLSNFLGKANMLALPASGYYPYFGYLGRASGFTVHPNMLQSLLAVSILLLIARQWIIKPSGRKEWLAVVILAASSVLTFSKMILALLIGLWILWAATHRVKRRWLKPAGWMVAAGLLVLLEFGTHVYIGKKGHTDWDLLQSYAYVVPPPFAEVGDYQLALTSYSILKASAFRAGIENPFFGVGMGRHNIYVNALKEEGGYPAFFPDFDPHCTYLGVFAEMGLVGLLALVFLMWIIAAELRKGYLLKDQTTSVTFLVISLSACFVVAAIEGLTTDIMNFRHYWVLLGALGAMVRQTGFNS